MDNLTTLLDRKEYKLVLDLTENNDDAKALYCRISAYLGLGKAKEAMEILEAKREILYKDSPLRCLRSNFELRFILNEYDEAYDDAKYFSSLPYVSQEVEEELRSLEKKIRYNERQSSLKSKYSEEEVTDLLLNGKDVYEIMALLSSFNDAKTIYYSETICKMIEKSDSNLVKTYGLLLLVKAKFPKNVHFSKNNVSYDLTPSKMCLPFEEKEAKELLSLLEKETKDPSASSIAKNIMNNVMFELYPENIFKKYSVAMMLVVLVNVAYSYLRSSFDDSALLEKYGVDKKEADSVQEELLAILKNAEQINV